MFTMRVVAKGEIRSRDVEGFAAGQLATWSTLESAINEATWRVSTFGVNATILAENGKVAAIVRDNGKVITF